MFCHARFSPARPTAPSPADCLGCTRAERACLKVVEVRVSRTAPVHRQLRQLQPQQQQHRLLWKKRGSTSGNAGEREFPICSAALENPVLEESVSDALTALQEALDINDRLDGNNLECACTTRDVPVSRASLASSSATNGRGPQNGAARCSAECDEVVAEDTPSYLRRQNGAWHPSSRVEATESSLHSGIRPRDAGDSLGCAKITNAAEAGAAVTCFQGAAEAEADVDSRVYASPETGEPGRQPGTSASFGSTSLGLADGDSTRLAALSTPPPVLYRSEEESKIVQTAWEKLVRWSRSWQTLNARKESHALRTTKKVAVLGGGSFGTAMAVMLARNKADMKVTLLLRDPEVCNAINNRHVNPRYFPRHTLPSNVVATTDAKEALQDAEYSVHAVPVQHSSAFLRSIAEHVPANLPILSVSKGLELSSMEMMSQLIPRALGNPWQPVAVLSGPSFSIELMDELPTAIVAASKDKDLARAAQQLLASRYLRVSTSSDVVGVEMAGALKNVLAIAAGIVEGMHLGNNCMAALVAQGCSEIRWLAEKMGAKPATLAGLSGTGDIMLTCFVKLSRNRSVGVRLGSGEKLEDILASMNQVAEGVATAGAVVALARKYRVQMPVLTAVARILDNQLTPKTAVLALMSLPQVEEV